MKVYFVRHGESILNAVRRYQFNDTPLSELGRRQAQLLTKRLIHMPINVIIASPLLRAKETVEIINKKLKKSIRFTPLLYEVQRPSEIDGSYKDKPEIKKIMELIAQNFHKGTWRYSNEETFEDLRQRANKFLSYLVKQKEKNILIVSHGIIISIIIAVMIFGPEITSQELVKWQQFVGQPTNVGITLCEYTAKKGWKLVVWNDHSHFG